VGLLAIATLPARAAIAGAEPVIATSRLAAPNGALNQRWVQGCVRERLLATGGSLERLLAGDGTLDRLLAADGPLEQLTSPDGQRAQLTQP
jgi:hypothetical protein